MHEQSAALTVVNMVIRRGSKNGWCLVLVIIEDKKRKKMIAIMKKRPLQINAFQSYLVRNLRGLELQLKGQCQSMKPDLGNKNGF